MRARVAAVVVGGTVTVPPMTRGCVGSALDGAGEHGLDDVALEEEEHQDNS